MDVGSFTQLSGSASTNVGTNSGAVDDAGDSLNSDSLNSVATESEWVGPVTRNENPPRPGQGNTSAGASDPLRSFNDGGVSQNPQTTTPPFTATPPFQYPSFYNPLPAPYDQPQYIGDISTGFIQPHADSLYPPAPVQPMGYDMMSQSPYYPPDSLFRRHRSVPTKRSMDKPEPQPQSLPFPQLLPYPQQQLRYPQYTPDLSPYQSLRKSAPAEISGYSSPPPTDPQLSPYRVAQMYYPGTDGSVQGLITTDSRNRSGGGNNHSPSNGPKLPTAWSYGTKPDGSHNNNGRSVEPQLPPSWMAPGNFSASGRTSGDEASSTSVSPLPASHRSIDSKPPPFARPDWAVGLKPQLTPRRHLDQHQLKEAAGTTAPGLFILTDPNTPAWKRLINHGLLPHEVVSLVETIFTSEDEVKMIFDLSADDAQSFINAIHRVCFTFFPFRGTI